MLAVVLLPNLLKWRARAYSVALFVLKPVGWGCLLCFVMLHADSLPSVRLVPYLRWARCRMFQILRLSCLGPTGGARCQSRRRWVVVQP